MTPTDASLSIPPSGRAGKVWISFSNSSVIFLLKCLFWSLKALIDLSKTCWLHLSMFQDVYFYLLSAKIKSEIISIESGNKFQYFSENCFDFSLSNFCFVLMQCTSSHWMSSLKKGRKERNKEGHSGVKKAVYKPSYPLQSEPHFFLKSSR